MKVKEMILIEEPEKSLILSDCICFEGNTPGEMIQSLISECIFYDGIDVCASLVRNHIDIPEAEFIELWYKPGTDVSDLCDHINTDSFIFELNANREIYKYGGYYYDITEA